MLLFLLDKYKLQKMQNCPINMWRIFRFLWYIHSKAVHGPLFPGDCFRVWVSKVVQQLLRQKNLFQLCRTQCVCLRQHSLFLIHSLFLSLFLYFSLWLLKLTFVDSNNQDEVNNNFVLWWAKHLRSPLVSVTGKLLWFWQTYY